LLEHHGLHEERGPETVRHLLKLLAGHDRNHLAQIERIVAAAGAAAPFAPADQKPEVPLDVIDKVDLRVGTIVDVADVAGADRLKRLTVDFGTGTRVVIAGIKEERSDPEALLGRQALFYYNVPRRTIRGEESQAMLCDVGFADGLRPALVQPERSVPNGVRAS
jgi:tRNA-binding protein